VRRETTVPDAIERSPAAYARLAGLLYLVIIVVCVASEAFVRESLVVAADATSTANNTAAAETLWRLSVAGQVGYLALALVVALVLYTLLRRVSRPVAQLAVMFNVVAIAIEATVRLLLIAPLVLTGPGKALAAIPLEQRHALAYFFLRLHDYGFGVSLVFFGGVCLTWGWLIRKSGFMPVAIGWLMQLAGACYLVNSFAVLLSPALARLLFPAILLPAFIGEVALCLWLLFRGLDVARWQLRDPDATVVVAAAGAR
jgi:hypothetical protein